ncbi:HET-domain-containing protein, partial [Thozetella sp. PMI_491]
MGRWHEGTCPGADVYLYGDGKVFPRCRNCNGSSEEAIRSLNQSAQNALPRAPPDEPPGQMNLRWPPSAPYTRRQASVTGGTTSTQAEDRSDLAPQGPLNNHPRAFTDRTQVRSISESSCYGSTLTGNEFRLIYLPSAQDKDEPLHVMLETYQHGNCPEYETVSYTWGGENDDCQLNQVIYVGEDWDILLQTKNCWQMLSWLRPRRGSRMIWVDAICINQENLDERGHQVARMEQIYSECSQVILWLGSDIVSPPQTDIYPRRHRFNDIQTVLGPLEINHIRVQEIFKRRYFGRVWVIQELVLAPRVVIPIYDYVFWLDGSPLSLPRNVAWEHTDAPWFTRVTLRALLAEDTFHLLTLTSHSQASDVRDRIFGVLGLQTKQENSLQADYNLSSQHVFVGFFSHCLINDRRLEILGHAAGLSDRRSNLTWVPQWKSHHDWAAIFQTPEKHSSETIEAAIRKISSPQDRSHLRMISQCGNSARTTTEVFKRRSWFKDCSVDADTGALSLYLT